MVIRTSFLIAALMIAAGVSAVVLRPDKLLAHERPGISLESIVPREFGEWREDALGQSHVVNPQTPEMLDKIYSQILARLYIHPSGYRIMLSLAYGDNQRGSLQAHKPEVCYPAQGFVVQGNEAGVLRTSHGDIPVRRLFVTMGTRQEPLMYWYTVGDTAVAGRTQKRLVELQFGLTGCIPDGMLFRVSSIDPDAAHAYRVQEQFVNQLLDAVSPVGRRRLSDLGVS